MSRIIAIVITLVILGSALGGVGYAAYNGYGASTSETQSARTGSVRGIFILGGGPSFGGK
jgi:flagellar basal body-associated protein FliL